MSDAIHRAFLLQTFEIFVFLNEKNTMSNIQLIIDERPNIVGNFMVGRFPGETEFVPFPQPTNLNLKK